MWFEYVAKALALCVFEISVILIEDESKVIILFWLS